jgi:hypothetical protein
LRAEIRSNHASLIRFNLERHVSEAVARVRSSNRRTPYTPFVPRESHTFLYTAIAKDISILPANVIDSVVLYYTQITTIALFIEDLRSDRYQSLDKDRKIQMYEDYVAMKIYARELAEDAMDAINTSLAWDKRVNNRVLARSDH